MKILVISLLRIGDIVLHAPSLRGLRERHPDAQIHLLINSQFRQIAPLMPYVDRVIPFERDLLQTGLGDGAIPLFDSYERLDSTVDLLNSEGYDTIVNLTHNRLSGWLTSLLAAKTKVGLCFDAQGRATFGSSWFRYLNQQVDAEAGEVFHYADVFRFALGLNDGDDRPRRASLIETASGREEANAFLAGESGKRVVAVQVLTSDAKKDWGGERFERAIELVARRNSNALFALLGAPFERERLTGIVERLGSKGVDARLAILSFEGAFSLLKSSALCLTGDTSIKHLACAARVPVVELSLGSADAPRTGAYSHGSVIIQSKEACAPCVHSKPCHRDRHYCARRIAPDVVAMVANEILEGRIFQLRTIAEEYKNEVDILRVQSRETGFWSAPSVLEPFSADAIGRWIDLTCRKIWLEGQGESARDPQFGTETRRLSALLHSVHAQTSLIEWRHMLADFQKQLEIAAGRVNTFKVGIQYLRGCYEDPRKMQEFIRGLISFRERIRHSALLKSFRASLDQVIDDDVSPAFTRFRRIQDLVVEIEKRTEIHMRLIRGLSQASEGEKDIERL